MILKKCQESDFEGSITVSNQKMAWDEFTAAMDQAISQLYNKSYSQLYNKFYQKNLIDARGLMIYGFIHCQGSQKEKQDGLMILNEKIRSWVWSSDKVGKFNYEDILRTILWFAT